jgi:hypothetical protein
MNIGTTGIGQNDMLMYSSCQCHHCMVKLVKSFCYQSWTFTCCPNQKSVLHFVDRAVQGKDAPTLLHTDKYDLR